MAPAVIIDTTSDFTASTAKTLSPKPTRRTLLLAPPSIAAQPDALSSILAFHDRNATDLQMLDRLVRGAVTLPPSAYDEVLLVSGSESAALLNRQIVEQIAAALKIGGRLRSQDGSFGTVESAVKTEAILAGLVDAPQDNLGGMVKPDPSRAAQTVTLKLGKKKTQPAPVAASTPAPVVTSTPAGVGFVDLGDDLDDGFDDFPSNEELQSAAPIDPTTLLSDADRQKPLIIPEACKPNSKRRRACKDCTCGLAERLNAEDTARREQADASLAKLSATDLHEVDFTIQGKVGSCGNCALGDAFRCDGCPYIGLPAFKPGEEVRLLSNDVQL